MKISLAYLWVTAVYAAPLNSRQYPDLRGVLTNPENDWSAGTVVSFAGSDEFHNATNRWTITGAPTFSAAISPANEGDVIAAVKLARKYSIPFLATGKRHGFTTTFKNFHEGLAIDLGQLKTYEIDPVASTITMGGSAGIGDFQDDLSEAGLMIQGGSGSCPGYVGLTVGAGVGRYMGYFGLVTDGLISARVVTATGELVQVSETENSDLFWGMRGAGANLGIITSATFQAHRMADHNGGYVLNADIIYSPDQSAEYFKYLESLENKLPGNVAGIHIMSYNNVTGEGQLLANWVWIGPEKEGREFMEQFLKLGPASVDAYEYIPWNKVLSTSIGGFGAELLCLKEEYRDFYTTNLRSFSAPVFQKSFERLQKWWEDYPDSRGSYINIEVFPNQATIARGHDFTAYPWRDAIAYMQVGIYADDPSVQKTIEDGTQLAIELRKTWDEISGYPEHTIYVNYAHGDETIEQVYRADKLPRLAALKKQWDPSNVFGFNNPLPTQYPVSNNYTWRAS
ncbi:Glucooligosaccharide oxidase [Melanomma pulvis-pyrius CBS 109.77]|uniref:Glucooligosaccharide oxidase n=1 Tax=Melanomma pulvis-pyrius CBS 109.77 TaxID=1314802 RepID=A0A6A6X775_9PLEO|nr:Glucooligosaccharide oxidase [Melanomma pulvis-pyrius CBS 109.77]